MAVKSLEDARSAKADEHAAKVRKLFDEHPECAREAVIIWPQGGVTLAPEHLSHTSIAGLLEAAKFGVLLTAFKEALDDL